MPAIVNTELGGGLQRGPRGQERSSPRRSPTRSSRRSRRNRFDVWVPSSTAAIATVMNLVPRRGREAIAKGLKADKVLAEADKGARAAYEDRAAHSSHLAKSNDPAADAEPATETTKTA